jgi:hypothetical protein
METIQSKSCNKCSIEKSLNDFYKASKGKLGRAAACKICQSNYHIEYYKRKIELNPDFNKIQYQKEKNSGLKKLQQIRFRSKNPNYTKKGSEQLEKTKIRRKNRYDNDIIFKLKQNIRNTIVRGLENKKSKITEDIIGCSIKDFMLYLESKFQDGMSWNNHGKNGWHIDHIFPLAKATSEEQIYKLNHYTNLQPLWWYDNLKKSDNISEEWGNERLQEQKL